MGSSVVNAHFSPKVSIKHTQVALSAEPPDQKLPYASKKKKATAKKATAACAVTAAYS